MQPRRAIFALAVAALGLTAATSPALAQGKGKAKHYGVTSDKAMTATRTVLQRQGFEIVRVARNGDAQVIYYRRGNMGRGKGLGPLEKMIVRPSNSIVVFDGGPSGVVLDLKIRLGL